MPELIKQIQRDLACPICGRKYELSQIKVRGSFEQILIIQTNCSDGHMTLFMTMFNEQDKAKNDRPAIATDEVLDLTNSLKNFKGDFEKLWAKKLP
jgi:C4-type Zn-finger protein